MRGVASLILVVGTLAGALSSVPSAAADDYRRPAVLSKIERYQDETWRWQRLMLKPRTPSRTNSLQSASGAYRAWVLDVWHERALRARAQARRPPLLAAWLCIHRHEGPWRANTGNGYYGGLQMDLAFQQRYAPGLLLRKGTADRWTPLEQIWVAVRAHRSGRGFHPWPQTAQRCGLISGRRRAA